MKNVNECENILINERFKGQGGDDGFKGGGLFIMHVLGDINILKKMLEYPSSSFQK